MIIRRTKVFLSQGEWDKSAFLVYRAKTNETEEKYEEL